MMTPIRRFLADLFGAYADGARVIRGLPLLFGAIIAWEFAQHVMEYRIGFYDSVAAAKAVSLAPSRMILGWIKMLLVYIGGFVTIRYLMLGRRQALRPSARSICSYLPYIAWSLLLVGAILHAGQLVPPGSVSLLRGVVGIGQVAIEPLLMVWIVSAATDGPVRNPIRSARVTGWHYPRALALFFIGRLPVNVVHHLLGTWSIGTSGALLWTMLVLDALAVGLVITIIPALYVRIARHVRIAGQIAERKENIVL